ncbi:hypothetical protein [Teredinibacter sp. KSP-S5-2]|uniref:hypothetical protein n=1 Tax=Teredinibacter sp. KSP-S5-2 TaxID=3034506 RepID=UPI00293483FC|nr:hypothetical protein [Teredinibacter sp. KSP-S5-2]WNO11524.1 hypothetical protein P5V12_10100 [Teredinibacter sp. KSP-S5-2]
MKYQCPGCGVNLKWRLIFTANSLNSFQLDGVSYQEYGKCPKCRCVLGLNPHPNEQKMHRYNIPLVVFALLLGLINSAIDLYHQPTLFSGLFIFASLLIVTSIVVSLKLRLTIANDWARYVKKEEEPLKIMQDVQNQENC